MRGWWRRRRGRLLQMWAVGLVAAVLVSVASALGYLEWWQVRALDLLQQLQGREPPHDVRLVIIDDAVFEGLGRRQPLSRQYLARVVRGLARSGAAVVGIDVTLTTPTTPDDDAALAAAIHRFSTDAVSRVVVLGPLSRDGSPLSGEALGASVLTASPAMPSSDGVIREVDPVVPDADGRPIPTLALAVAARMAGLDGRALEDAMAAGRPLALPRAGAAGDLAASGQPTVVVRPGVVWPINYAGPANTFTAIRSDDVAAVGDADDDPAADNPFRGRIVLVGGTFADARDVYPTPHGLMAGVEVHANVVHMLTTRRFIRPSSWLAGFAIDVLVVLTAGIVLTVLRPLPGSLVCVLGASVLGVPAALLAFERGGYWIDFVLPVAATALTGIGSDVLDRRRLRDSFARYLSRDVLGQVLADAPGLQGEHRTVSILFSDLRGFTTLAEHMPPAQVVARLNEYFDAMTAAVFAQGGMINDFVGDAVMAVFGAPVADADHAWHAVQSAVAMNAALEALNRRWEAAALPRLRMGIGIHTGAVFAGNVGGRARVKYTVVGDAVNVASRVEGLNKDLSTTILITEETLAAVVDRVRARDRGPVTVKGRVEKVRVYEVLTDGRTGG